MRLSQKVMACNVSSSDPWKVAGDREEEPEDRRQNNSTAEAGFSIWQGKNTWIFTGKKNKLR